MKLFNKKVIALFLITILSISLFAGCKKSNNVNEENESKLSGIIEIDGSSTVFPITEAVAEEFNRVYKDVKVTVAVSGTGGGFKRFTVGETDISDASRPIKDKEAKIAKDNNIDYTELTVAIDGIAVVVNSQNDWAKNLTVEELNKIWSKDGGVKTWKDVNPAWPDEEIKLYGPGTDSGTFDYFTEEILGDDEIRTDFIPSEDDNVLVQGVVGDKYALGYFGYAYYVEYKDQLKAVAINGVEPTGETIEQGTYSPLSRPIFIYVSNDSYNNKPQVKEFVKFYMENANDLVPETGYIPLGEQKYIEELNKLNK